ncbi:isoleucine--tRNA ligase [bacterium]|nr:isoleucine--tRNA ligase [bacterium]
MAESKLSGTVLLPKTSFAMRGQMARQEPLRLEAWARRDVYAKLRAARKNAPAFYLHDGPPYANGNIHIGHALNKILKDIVVRYKFSRGFDAPYLPGWDCHGLPIELKALEGRPGGDKLSIRKACRAYAEKYLSIQREEFKRLGILGEFENPYVTMNPAYQAGILEGLANLVERGFIARAEKPVLWCARCRTALADAEVEYEEDETPAITVKFPVDGESKTFLLIWTTTPWTLPANLAVAVNPEARYVRAKVGGETWIVAESRAGVSGVPAGAEAETLKGSDLTSLTYRHPFAARTGRVFPAGFVTLDAGTGLVHIAPGHGDEDFQLGRKVGLPTFCPVDAAGKLTADAGEFAGRSVFDANPAIIDKLESSGSLVKHEKMTHSYPHCWRCKKPVIFRATPQWFLKVDHEDLRKKMLAAISRIRWVPAAGEKRIAGMVESRPDWCISRQRAWGVPIPAVHCESCGKAHLRPDVIRNLAGRCSADPAGADVWFSDSPSAFLPAGWTCPDCGGAKFRREEDILDVWFDSGMSHVAALEKRYGVWPADLYLEGSDQHRGWFQLSLLVAIALKGHAPFRQVLTHGFVMDGEGRKMSKSIGNVVTPQEIVQQHGADVLRLWAASCDYSGDVRLGPAILAETVDTYRRIRNTIRFLLGVLFDFEPRMAIPAPDLDPIDRYLLGRLVVLTRECLAGYDDYDFSAVSRRLRNFCAEDLSGFYLDVLKDRLYCDAADSKRRRSSQTVLWTACEQILQLITPILPFTADEAMESWNRPDLATAEIRPPQVAPDEELEQVFGHLLRVRKDVNLKIEECRKSGQIGGSLDARVSIRTAGDEGSALRMFESSLPEILIVSSVELSNSAGDRDIRVGRVSGEKCERCWKYVPARIAAPPGLICARCAGVLDSAPGQA